MADKTEREYYVTWKVRFTRSVTAASKAEALAITEDLAYGDFSTDPIIEAVEVTNYKVTVAPTN
tara:strand:- start:239 stop:430 length:192 start_codon:yes stop_codon:yes gene_type:complete